ncbi:MAG: hypothetical protein JXR68_06995 [Bacteroidales bacterium]|nr:hypothetical protein [Bacteroidales bacterium]
MKKFTIVLFILILFPLFYQSAIGQPPPPPPQDIPIDGGLLVLLVAGIVYGGRKFYKNKLEE